MKKAYWAVLILMTCVAVGIAVYFHFADMPEFSVLEYQPLDFVYEDTALSAAQIQEQNYAMSNDNDYEFTYSRRKAEASFNDLCSFGVDADIFYPGALIDIKTMNPIQIGRAPLTISLNAETWLGVDSSKISTTIQRPSLHSMRQGISSILSGVLKPGVSVSSQIAFDIREIKSTEDFALGLGLKLNAGRFNLDDNFAFESIQRQTNIVVVLKQIFYTVDVSLPNSPHDFFADFTPAENIRKAIPATKIPTYVASVAYGRIALIAIQSNFSKEQIENELKVSFSGIKLSNSISKIISLEDTTSSCFMYGGSEKDAYELMGKNSLPEIIEVLKTSYDPLSNIGLPISYRFRHLDGSLSQIRESNEYDVKEVRYIPKKLVDWQYWDDLITAKEMLSMKELKLDFTNVVNTDAYKTLIVPSNIEVLSINGGNDIQKDRVLNGITLDIKSREKDIDIILQNVSFVGNNGNAIQCPSSKVNLKIEGVVELAGAEGFAALDVYDLNIGGNTPGGLYRLSLFGGNGKERKGNSAINANSINITTVHQNCMFEARGGNGDIGFEGGSALVVKQVVFDGGFGDIILYGGTGGNGVDGTSGKNGGVGISGATSLKAEAVQIQSSTVRLFGGKGGNGGAGGNGGTATAGGNGGNGGQGGLAAEIGTLIITGGQLHVTGGDGGNGGKGGQGGKGSDGEQGRVRLKNDSPKDGGVGGTGGVGGNGGDGGKPGATVYIKELIGSENISYGQAVSGNGGDGGKGGVGGNGGDGGTTSTVYVETPYGLNGGRGGTGGRGGDGGRGFVGGAAGQGGSGGVGGQGKSKKYGLFQQYTKNGNDGAEGIPGSDGSPGALSQ